MVYCVVLAASLCYGTVGSGHGVHLARLIGFVAVLGALLAVETAEWRWPTGLGTRRVVLALLALRLGLFAAAVLLDSSGESRVLFVLAPFAAYFAFGRGISLLLGGLCLALLVGWFALRVPRWYAQQSYVSDVLMFGVGLVLAIAMAGIAVGEQAGRIRLAAALREVRQSHDQLAGYAARVAELSAATERNRLARDIHDSLGHHLTAITVQLEKAEAFRGRDHAAADQAVAHARASARQALQEVRGSVRALRGQQPPAPLSAMLAALVPPAGDGEPQVTLSVTGEEAGIDADLRMLLFRSAQEALTNVRRHSGARRVRVAVVVDDHQVRLAVADDGRGFDPARSDGSAGRAAPDGFGLLGMRERAALAGGHARVDSKPGSGTTVTVTVPRSAPADVVPA
jgi:signal transduction histidine kinase